MTDLRPLTEIDPASRETGLDPERNRLVRRTLATPAAARLNLSLVSAAPDEVRIALPFTPANRTEGEVVHGGVIATLADIAGVAVAIAGSRQLPTLGATRSLALHFLAPAVGCDLEARAVLLRGGGRNNVARVTVLGATGEMMAEAHVDVMLR